MHDSKLLRAIDRYVGQPSCTAVSWARAILPKDHLGKGEAPRKILLVELFEMGAAVMLVPTIRHLRQKYPGVEIHCLTRRSCVPIWNAIKMLDADKIHVIEGGSAAGFVASIARVILKLRSIRFDLVVDYELFMRVPALIVGLLRSRSRAGFYRYRFEGLKRGEFYDRICAYNQNTHIARNYLALTKTAAEGADCVPNFKGAIDLSELQISPTTPPPSAGLLGSILGVMDGLPYIVVCPDVGPTLSVRNYPRDAFAKVVQALLDRYPKHRVVVLGTSQDKATASAVLELVRAKDRCIDLCGRTSFDELMQVIAGASLLVTNDNGPGHFAALTGTPTVAMFSTDSPFIYGPLGDTVIAYTYYQCSPCISAYNHKVSVCDSNRCLQSLAPERVIALACDVLDGKAKFRTINGEVPYLN